MGHSDPPAPPSSSALGPHSGRPQGRSSTDAAHGEGKRCSEGQSVTLPRPSSGHPSAWKEWWCSDLTRLRSRWDVSNSKQQVSSAAGDSVSPQQKTLPKRWNAEAGQAPAVIKNLKIDYLFFLNHEGSLSPPPPSTEEQRGFTVSADAVLRAWSGIKESSRAKPALALALWATWP